MGFPWAKCICKAVFETAFLHQADWKAKWIECSFERKNACGQNFGNSYPPVLFEKEFLLEKRVKVPESMHLLMVCTDLP